jgi:hypothetical protein
VRLVLDHEVPVPWKYERKKRMGKLGLRCGMCCPLKLRKASEFCGKFLFFREKGHDG